MQTVQATYDNLTKVADLTPAARHKLMAILANKTEAEQIIIFGIRGKIYSKIRTSSPEQAEQLQQFRREQPVQYDYYILILAIQIHLSTQNQSQYIAKLREARQKTESLRNITLGRAVEVLLPLVEELRKEGATWAEVAQILNNKQRKVLCNRKLSTDYLKKTYGKLKHKKATP